MTRPTFSIATEINILERSREIRERAEHLGVAMARTVEDADAAIERVRGSLPALARLAELAEAAIRREK